MAAIVKVAVICVALTTVTLLTLTPGFPADPYLAFAAMMMAGLDWVVQLGSPARRWRKGISTILSPEEMKNTSMPRLLDEAEPCVDIAVFAEGRRVHGELIESSIDRKRKNEAEAVRLRCVPRIRPLLRYLNCTC